MRKRTYKPRFAWAVSAAVLSGSLAAPTSLLAADAETDDSSIEEVVVIGSRRAARSAADTPAPVDVIQGEDFVKNASTDVQDLLRTAVPSYNVNSQPISDAATISRPANLRGLSPDNTLVLVNGKRRHRGSVISFLGGGISDGAQGVDIATIPALALKRVEVLRDGASSQYGSDAIAGVINFVLRDDPEGGFLEVNGGSTYDGDGDNFRIAGNYGFALGDRGFVNITGEFGEVDGTVRSVVRDDVQALIDAGNTAAADFQTINAFTDEVPQYWGQPDVTDDVKFFVNSAFEINDNAEVYLFGNWAQRTATGGFFYRNPTNRGGVYAGPEVDPVTGAALAGGVPSVLVGDVDGLGVGGACPAGIPLTGNPDNNLIPDPSILASVTADDNCFSFVETIPGGFVPRFGGDNEDRAIAFGVRGAFDQGLTYDVSYQIGSNETEFFITNTVNASLGADSPRDFIPGGQQQTETVINADFSYPFSVGLFSDLNVGFGFEYREEEFDLRAGDDASFALGPLASQGFSSSSNGFGGFPNDSSSSQDSYAGYIDLEADVTEQLTLQGAFRYEDFSQFGDTSNYKIAALYRITEAFRVRATFSTGFHAPTAGQANITNVTTQIINGVLVDQGTLPLSSTAGQLAADFIESQGNGRPELGPEEAENLSIGIAFDIGGSSWTLDYYDIDVEDRVALGQDVDFLAALNFAGGGANFASVSDGLTQLDAAGTIDRNEFIGLDDLQGFRFFANSFSTNTQGIDLVGRYGFDFAGGYSGLTLAFNFNTTDVKDLGTVNPINEGRVAALEDLLPEFKGNLTWNHTQGKFRSTVRLSYFGDWDDTTNGVDNISAEWLVDAEVGYSVTNELDIVAGVNNLFDTFNDTNPLAGQLGQQFPESGPFGFNGGQWYLKARYSFY